jgi:hypothetical protein
MEYGDVIQQVLRTLDPASNGRALKLLADYTAGSGTITLDYNNPYINEVRIGSILSVGLNLLYVYGTPNSGTGVTSVVGGYGGSTDANEADTLLAYVNPAWTQYDIAQHVNQEILSLSAPDVGIGQVETIDITFVPPYTGYDLGANFDPDIGKVLEVQYKKPPPDRTYPTLRRGEYRVLRHQTDTSAFPNGNGIVIYKDAWPGFPLHVSFLSPFAPLVNLTDDLLGVSGIPLHTQDVVVLGTINRIAPDREISRNAYDRQPDPRKASEVPPGARMNAANNSYQRYLRRRNEEASIFKQAWPYREYA